MAPLCFIRQGIGRAAAVARSIISTGVGPRIILDFLVGANCGRTHSGSALATSFLSVLSLVVFKVGVVGGDGVFGLELEDCSSSWGLRSLSSRLACDADELVERAREEGPRCIFQIQVLVGRALLGGDGLVVLAVLLTYLRFRGGEGGGGRGRGTSLMSL